MSRLLKLSLALIFIVGAVMVFNVSREDDNEEAIPLDLDEGRMKNLSKIGYGGFLVWERSRNGVWEIWTKKLSGGKERRLVPREKGRQHFCPQVSPDGKRLAYMSYRSGTTPYPKDKDQLGSLWIMDIGTRKRSKVVPLARSYAEDRAVTWLDNDNFCFIDENGVTQKINLWSRVKEPLTKKGEQYFGYLPSPNLKHGTTGTPDFASYDAETKTMRPRQRLAGCQPYFTRDSVWGYWMGGAGGPMNKIRLATGEIGQIMKKDDTRLHGKRNYVYFPMISPCQNLLTFAASGSSHDHFEADYDIYVAHLNPKILEIIGTPVRYTSYKKNDRFPDVYRRELPLGTFYVEGKTDLQFSAPKGDDWYWHITGGFNSKGLELTHTFEEPGEYWISARRGKVRIRGYINVSAAKAPTVEGTRREGKSGMVVDFDEAVDPVQAKVILKASGKELPWKLRDGGFSLLVDLPEGTTSGDSLVVSGFQDRAQNPNAIGTTEIAVPGADWPASNEGLVFVWENNNGRTKLQNGTASIVEPKGLAFWDENGVMKLRGGWFDSPNAGELVSSECRKTNELSIEFVITPEMLEQTQGPRNILTLAHSPQEKNLAIIQEGNNLILWLRTPQTGPDGRKEETHVVQVDNSKSHHLVLNYAKNRLNVFLDGNKLWNRDRLEGDFSNWEDMKLRFGASSQGDNTWRGLIERVCIYNRRLSEKEVAEHANASIVAVASRAIPVTRTVRVRLVEQSETPPLQEFQPYTEALVRHLYEVVEVLEGPPLPDKEIVVAHWSWMNSLKMPAQKLNSGDTITLKIHSEADHPELKNLFVRDDLLSGFDAAHFIDATDWDIELK